MRQYPEPILFMLSEKKLCCFSNKFFHSDFPISEIILCLQLQHCIRWNLIKWTKNTSPRAIIIRKKMYLLSPEFKSIFWVKLFCFFGLNNYFATRANYFIKFRDPVKYLKISNFHFIIFTNFLIFIKAFSWFSLKGSKINFN